MDFYVPTEKEVQRHVKKLLALFGVGVYDTSQPFKAAITPGVPDLICFCQRRGLFFVEVKRPGGKQSEEQAEFQRQAEAAGVPYILGGVDEVKAFLEKAIGS